MSEEQLNSSEEPQDEEPSYVLDVTKVVGVGLIIVMVLAGLLLPPVRLIGRIFGGGGFTAITDSEPLLTHDDGLTVSTATTDGSLRVKLSAISPTDFYDRNAGGGWGDALDALPATLQLISPIFEIEGKGTPSSQVLLDVLPGGTGYRSETIDLYTWDAERGEWIFVANSFNLASGRLQATLDTLPLSIAAFNTTLAPQILAVTQEPGQTLSANLSSSVDIVMAAGLQPAQDGSVTGTMASASGNFVTLPLVRNYSDPTQVDSNTLLAILADVTVQQTHLDALAALASADNNVGVALDYRGLQPEQEPAYTAFVAALANILHDADKRLVIIVPSPEPDANFARWGTAGYNWRALGGVADILQVSPGLLPTDYTIGGPGGRMMLWATDEVSRYKLLLGTSTLSVAVTDQGASVVPYRRTLNPLRPSVDPALPQNNEEGEESLAYLPGEALTFALGGNNVSNFGIDPMTGIYRYDHLREGVLNQYWMVTPPKVRERLALATTYNLAGVGAYDLLSDDNIPDMEDALIGYKLGAPTAAQNEFQIEWQIKDDEDAVVTSATVPFGQTFIWETVEDLQGNFTAVASLFSPNKNERGSLEVAFAAPAPTPTPEPALAAVVSSSPGVSAAVSTASGGFELGGQTHALSNPDAMHSAGMTWVKFQQKWSPGASGFEVQGRVDQGHASGFKVLFSIPGPDHPSSIDYNAFVNYLSEVAQTGVDGIEVWNEQNFDREWPPSELNGAIYVNNMLAPAFNAIKAVNSGILVISGAPTPTGAFPSCGGEAFGQVGCNDFEYIAQMAAAGADNFMDCAGVHFNAGATSPHATSGHPADGGDGHYSWYYQGMVNLYSSTFSKPLCFTELGYAVGPGLPENFSWANGTDVNEHSQWLGETVGLARGYARLLIVWNVDIGAAGSDPQGAYSIVRGGGCPACGSLAAN